ncbi:MAG: VCBS repeat-containing protein, partial [Myxococcota bacterium]|nr:VCBS repeat-containing protein [Myxococcota bacterium]
SPEVGARAPSGVRRGAHSLGAHNLGSVARVAATSRVEAAKPANGPWQLVVFELTELTSLVSDRRLFDDVSAAAGVARAEGLVDYSMPPANGLLFEYANNGMTSVADVDNDGLMDFLVTSMGTKSVLYRNTGSGFEAWRPEGGDPLLAPAWGGLFFDHDNDGDSDYFFVDVATDTPRLLVNQLVPSGTLSFTAGWHHDQAIARPDIAALNAFSGAVAADINRDQIPDVLVLLWASTGPPNNVNGATNGSPNLLFVSQPDGTYVEAAERWGVAGHHFSHAAQFVDLDQDGLLDVYVVNDFSGGNFLLRNAGDHFEDITAKSGLRDRGWAMGVTFGDVDNDGDLDVHVSRMSSTVGARVLALLDERDVPDYEQLEFIGDGNKVYENRGDGTFVERANLYASWSYGGGFVDLDGSGVGAAVGAGDEGGDGGAAVGGDAVFDFDAGPDGVVGD